VDDREENRELLARYLTRSGHFVVTAPGGAEALDLLEGTDVDVVLLDRMMPGMDGREVLRRIKAEPRWRATPVIMISGEQDMQGIIDCIEAGADDYLFKPFNPVLLQARIKAGIERKRWYDREQLYRDQLERNERLSARPSGAIFPTTSSPRSSSAPRAWSSAATCARSRS
jgi:adenylate cyclase